MGSSLTPTSANIFVSELKKKIISKLGKKSVLTWIRNVDETFATVESKDMISDMSNSFY